jgi:hypothetical protein
VRPAPPTIPRQPPADVGLDYVALIAEGTALLQELSGLNWTNYNYSDPGVTILEQLCYALTELSYRAHFPVPDLLAAPETGRVELSRQGLYPARSIMPVNPVTINDLRRLIIDRVPDVGNAWFTPIAAGETGGVRGLYRLALLVPGLDPGCDDHGPDPAVVREQALDCYTAHRALCEDVEAVIVLRPLSLRIGAKVQLDDHSDPDAVLADMLFRLELALAPEPRRTSLDEQLALGLTTAEIFDGPLMLRGFIADGQLTALPCRVPVNYLLELMAETPGVLSVDDGLTVQVGADGPVYAPGDMIEVPDGFVLRLGTAPDPDGRSIRLMHGIDVCRTDPLRVGRRLARAWADRRRTYGLWAEYSRHYASPTGEVRGLADYCSVQNQFPEVYGIGAYGLPAQAGAARHAQARQLKGYLMVFDQLMADFLAQIAFVRDLFSVGAGGDRTYVSQSLRPIVPNVLPLLQAGYDAGLKSMVAAGDPVAERQDAVFDFLLSLYAEAITLPAGSACGSGPRRGSPAAALIEAKQALLKRTVPATRDRGRGFDYRRSDRGSGMAGLEIRCRIELALLDATRRQGGPTAVADPVAADFGHLLDPALGGVIARDFLPVETSDREADGEREEGPSPLAGKRVAAALLPALADPRRYRVGALPGKGPVYLVCRDMAGGWWALGEYRDVAEAVDMTDRLVAATDSDRRLLHIVEWTLLRSARHHRHDGTDRDDRGLDFSFRVSAVLPRGDEGEDRRWREGARGIVRDNIPAHVGVDMLFLGRRRMRHFRRLYDAWREALRHGPPERRARTSRHLERFLRHERPPVPPPPPPPDPIHAFAIAADPVVPGSPVTFTLSWKVAEGAIFRIVADDGPGGSTRMLPVPVSGAGSLQVAPRRLQVTYTLEIVST